eukprot:tig00021105_g18225.t1
MVGVTGTVTSTGLLNANGGLNVRWNQFVVDMSGNTLATGMVGFVVDMSGNTLATGMVGVTGTVTSTGLLNANGGLNVRWNQFVVDMSGNTLATAWSGWNQFVVDMSGNTLATGMVGFVWTCRQHAGRAWSGDGTVTSTGLLNANGGLNVRWNQFVVDMSGNTLATGMVGFVVDMSGNTLATGMVGVTGTVTSTGLLNANGG